MSTLVDITSGQKSRRKRHNSKSGSARNGIPILLRRAMRAVRGSLFNPKAIEEHLDTLASISSAKQASVEDRLRYWVDSSRYAAVLEQAPRLHDEVEGVEIWEYEPAYHPGVTGRLYEIGGGLQTCSRLMKTEARYAIPNVHNYDAVNCHPRLLVYVLEQANMASSWLTEYVADPEAKRKAVNATGLTASVWKQCFLAVMNGAHVPLPSQLPYAGASIVESMLPIVGRDNLRSAYTAFYDYLSEFLDDLKAWQEYLLNSWLNENSRYVAPNRKTYVRNAVGMVRSIEDMAPTGIRHELVSRLIAHILQGWECVVMHRLVASSSEHGFRVMSHEFDGIVTLGEVPDYAVETATVEAGLPADAVVLRQKPFL